MKFIEVSPVEIRVNVKGLSEIKTAVVRGLLKKARLRCGISGVISVIVHIFLIFGFMATKALHKPVVQEIREISFVDLSEEPEIKLPPKPLEIEIQKESATASFSNPAENLNAETPVTPQRFDMVREQAPMHLASIAPASHSQVLMVSPAKGTRDDDKIKNLSAPIALNRGQELAAAGSSIRTGKIAGGSPQISLERRAATSNLGGAVSGGGERPSSNIGSNPVQTMPAAVKQTSTFITGPLGNRKILEKVIPSFPLWAKRQGVGANVSLQFTVMEDGLVKENVVVVLTSGSKEWDDAVIAALKKWRFAPLAMSEQRQNQTGVITFQFVID
jgi:TonB family protein